jgi:predicted  nucleic acid-binding Zn-ribbon protein
MEKVCEMCGKVYEAERAVRKYCSGACRAKAERVSARSSAREEDSSVRNGVSSVRKEGEMDSSVRNLAYGSSSARSENPIVRGDLMLVDANDEVIEAGKVISEQKKEEMQASKLPSVSLDEPCKMPEVGPLGGESLKEGEVYLDLVKDLGLDLKRDLGCFAVSRDGWFIRPDITIQQVRNIRRIIEARHGCVPRTYDDSPLPYSTSKVG